MSFAKFLTKHAGELLTTVQVVGTLADNLPLSRKEKDSVTNALKSLKKSVASIEDSVKEAKKLTEIKVSKADVRDAVKDTLSGIVTETVEKAIKSSVTGSMKVELDQSIAALIESTVRSVVAEHLGSVSKSVDKAK